VNLSLQLQEANQMKLTEGDSVNCCSVVYIHYVESVEIMLTQLLFTLVILQACNSNPGGPHLDDLSVLNMSYASITASLWH